MNGMAWKEVLADKMPAEWAEEIDHFEQKMHLRKHGKLPEKVFAELRLRRGVYGQRYDNGQRHDGIETRTLDYPSGALTKGPNTVWDAPGMMRIKIPWGGLTTEQMEVLADVAEEYSGGVLHVTTRQDIQLHFVHIEDTPDLMRRLAAVGITTREACGNSVRNVSACPLAGVCGGEAFDVTPYANALAFYLLGHEDAQDFGRKFKVAFSGCRESACGLTSFHDIGFIAKTRTVDGKLQRGFELYVGGGLGAVPSQAKLFSDFLPVADMLPTAQAICRVFARLGEKKSRARARMKFLVTKLGIDEFKRLVLAERQSLPEDPRWHRALQTIKGHHDAPAYDPAPLPPGPYSKAFEDWRGTNVRPQKQPGYSVVTITCPLGDLSPEQMRGVADMAREFAGETIRTTVEQNLVMRWVPNATLVQVHQRLQTLGLAESSAGTIVDVTACPGTDTCKLGHASSRGLAGELHERLAARYTQLDQAVKELRIKVSGCFNSCGQHHVADLGFYGVGRKVKGYMVPHFQVILGGQWRGNGGSFGLAIGAVPSKNVPDAVIAITNDYIENRSANEPFKDYVARVGKGHIKSLLAELQKVPPYQEQPHYYSDWGDPREYTTGDLGKGECAGEVVTAAEIGLTDSERRAFEAQLRLDAGDFTLAGELAFDAMLAAARALLSERVAPPPDTPDAVVEAFRAHYCETKLFHDPFAGGKFAQYLFEQHANQTASLNADHAHQRVEEAQLFIEAAYGCYSRLSETTGARA